MLNRVCYVDVEIGRSQAVREDANTKVIPAGEIQMVRYSGLDVKFNISLDASGWVSGGTISVCGLNEDTIRHYMDTIGWQDIANRRWIRLFAGYEDTGYDCIFSGKVCACHPTLQPEVWLEMEVMSPELVAPTLFKVQSDSGSLYDVSAQVANAMNLSFGPSNYFFDRKEMTKESYQCEGAFTDQKRKLEGYHGGSDKCAVIVRNGSLWVIDKTKKNNDPWKGKYPTQEIREDQMVGIPRFNWPNMNVNILLYPGVFPFQQVRLAMSERYGKWCKDKTYYINTITHNGHYRGGGWTTSMQLVDKSRYTYNGKQIEVVLSDEEELARIDNVSITKEAPKPR